MNQTLTLTCFLWFLLLTWSWHSIMLSSGLWQSSQQNLALPYQYLFGSWKISEHLTINLMQFTTASWRCFCVLHACTCSLGMSHLPLILLHYIHVHVFHCSHTSFAHRQMHYICSHSPLHPIHLPLLCNFIFFFVIQLVLFVLYLRYSIQLI